MLIVTVTIVLAAGGWAVADQIPFNGAESFVVHLTNYDDSAVYDWNGGFLADDQTAIVLGQAYDPSLLKKITNGYATRAGEDGWGIFKFDQILRGEISGPNGITPSDPSEILFSDGDGGIEIVGIFYGRTDVSVTWISPGVLGTQRITAMGDKYEVFTQPAGTYNDGGVVGGPGATLRVDENEYPTVGYDGTGTNTLMAGAERVITGFSQAGMRIDEVLSVFTPDAGGSGAGVFSLYMSLGAVDGLVGTQNAQIDKDPFPTIGVVPAVGGTTADLQLMGTTSITSKEWLVSSSDPLTGIPEPTTLSLMALGAWLHLRRKRR